MGAAILFMENKYQRLLRLREKSTLPRYWKMWTDILTAHAVAICKQGTSRYSQLIKRIKSDGMSWSSLDPLGYKELQSAIRLWRSAAERGLAEAQSNLGTMHALGRGVTLNEASAVKFYEKAARQGHAQSMLNLGFMYQTGRGVLQSDK